APLLQRRFHSETSRSRGGERSHRSPRARAPRGPRHGRGERAPGRRPSRESRKAPSRPRRHDPETRGRAVTASRPPQGYFFDDFRIGRRFDHATPRTLTESDASLYLALTGSRYPLHCSAPLARACGYPATPLDDLLVFHVAFGKTVPDI